MLADNPRLKVDRKSRGIFYDRNNYYLFRQLSRNVGQIKTIQINAKL
jgi:hypothetical protein